MADTTQIKLALSHFVSENKAERTEANAILEKAPLPQVCVGLLEAMEELIQANNDPQGDSSQLGLGAIILRKRLVRDESNIEEGISTSDKDMMELRAILSTRTIGVIRASQQVDARRQLISLVSAVCGIFWSTEMWADLFALIREKLEGDGEHLCEALRLIEYLCEYPSVREVLVSVGTEFLGAVDVAISHADPMINTQAARNVTAFLEYFQGSEHFPQFCGLIPKFFEVCIVKNPSEENLTSLNSVLTTITEDTSFALSEFIESPVPILEALHKVYGNEDEEEHLRGQAMQAFAGILVGFNDWVADPANSPTIIHTFNNIMEVIQYCLTEQWETEAKDEYDAQVDMEDAAFGDLLQHARAAKDVIIAITDEESEVGLKYLQHVMQLCGKWNDPSQWALAWAGYDALDAFIYAHANLIRRHRVIIWDQAFSLWSNTEAVLPGHVWLHQKIIETTNQLCSELMSLDPFLDDMVVRVLPFLLANCLHPSGASRAQVAMCLGTIASTVTFSVHHPKCHMKSVMAPMAEQTIQKLIAAWSINMDLMTNAAKFTDEKSQKVLLEQAEMFDAAGKWGSLYSQEAYPVCNDVLTKAIQIVELIGSEAIGSEDIYANMEGSSRCMQVGLKVATDNIMSQFIYMQEETETPTAVLHMIEKLVVTIIKLNELIDQDVPFYATGAWKTLLLESLGNLGASGVAFNPYIDQTLPIFLAPLAKEGGTMTYVDSSTDQKDGATVIPVVHHGQEIGISIDTQVWEDQIECVWGLTTLLQSYNSEKLLAIGDTILNSVIPVFEKESVQSPIHNVLCTVIGAAFKHFGKQIVKEVIPANDAAMQNFTLRANQCIDMISKKLQEVSEVADQEEDMYDQLAICGGLDTCAGIFRCLELMREGGMVISDELIAGITNRCYDEVAIPSVKMYLSNAARDKSELSEVQADLEESNGFLSELENFNNFALKVAGPMAFDKIESNQLDEMWAKRLYNADCEMYERCTGIIAFANFLKWGGEKAANKYAEQFIKVCITFCTIPMTEEIERTGDVHEDNAIRQSAAFGISVLFESCFNKISEADQAAMIDAITTCCMNHELATHIQRRNILENGLMAFIYYNLHKNSPPGDVLKYFQQFPIAADVEEMDRVSSLLVKLHESNHPWATDASLKPYIVEQLQKTLICQVEVENPKLMSKIGPLLKQ